MTKDIDLKFVIAIAIMILLTIFILICVGWSIYAFIKYGDKPITEIPAWALWFMFGGN